MGPARHICDIEQRDLGNGALDEITTRDHQLLLQLEGGD